METPLRSTVGECTRHYSWRSKQKNGEHLLPPGPLAEDLNPDAALKALRHYFTLRKPEGHLLSAWAHIEYAMNQSLTSFDDDLRRKYMDDAMYLLAGIITGNDTSKVDPDSRLYTDALVLNSFLPLFTKRALVQPITRADASDAYHSTGYVIKHLLDMQNRGTSEGSYRKTKLSESLGRALGARTLQADMILYPASTREEGSASKRENHDSYFIKNGYKLPIDKKLIDVGNVYDHPIQTLYIEQLAKCALLKAGIEYDIETIFPATAALSELVTEDIFSTVDKREASALNFATRTVAAKYRYISIAA